MHKNDIELNETYFFLSSDSPKRKHLEGTAFKVTEIRKVYRKQSYARGKRTMKVTRYFNDDGVGARAEELGVLPANWCPDCNQSEMKFQSSREGRKHNWDVFECPNCGHEKIIQA